MSVYGTGRRGNNCNLFSTTSPRVRFGTSPKLCLSMTWRMFTVASVAVLTPAGAGIFNLLCIDYALRPHLSSRLTLGGRTWPRKPWVYGEQDSHLFYRYSCLHSHSSTLHFPFPSSFAALMTLSYHSSPADRKRIHSFGIVFDRQSFSARHRSMSQLLRTV